VPPLQGLYTGATALLANAFEIVILHVPRGIDGLIRAAVAMADEVLLVVAPDLFSLHATRRATLAFDLEARPDRCRVILNPAIRHQIGQKEIERVLGVHPFGAVRFDPTVPRAQGRSRLLSPRAGRAAKDVRILAGRLVSERKGAFAERLSLDGSES